VFANFSYLYYYAIVALLLCLRCLVLSERPALAGGRRKLAQYCAASNMPVICVSAIFTCIAIVPLTRLIRKEALFFGGSTGFWQDSVRSIIEKSFYRKIYFSSQVQVAEALVLGVLVAALLCCVWACVRRRGALSGPLIPLAITGTVFCLLLCITTLLHYTLGTKFIYNRTAQFLIVLLSLLFVFLFDAAAGMRMDRRLAVAARCLFVLLCSGYIAACAMAYNVTYVLDWKHEASTRSMLEDLKQLKEPRTNVRLAGSYLFGQTIRFYKDYYDLEWLDDYVVVDDANQRIHPGYKDTLAAETDYLYLSAMAVRYWTHVDRVRIEEIKHYGLSDTMLVQVIP